MAELAGSRPAKGSGQVRVGLVQINNSFSGQDYFPLSIGLLQAYVQADTLRSARYQFLPPAFRREPLRELAARLGAADVVALSLYVWNIRYSLELARMLKRHNPDILIVAGGPQVPAVPEAFLRKHTCLDIACHGEGEETFMGILERHASRDWSELQAVSYLAPGGGFHQHHRISRIAELSRLPSPYLAGTFDRLLAEHPGQQWLGLWETNRGCPFSCSFCEWGASELNQVHNFEMDRLEAELEWLARHSVEFIFCCDSNFGMFPRDLALAERVATLKKRYGYPHALSIQSSKSAPERVYKINRLLHDHDLNKGVLLALQSVHTPTLKAVRRGNISMQAFKMLQHRFQKDGIQTFTDLILGLPEESYESFADGVSRIIANGQHNRIQFINLSILDNSEMGQPAYQKKYGMEIVESESVNIHGLVHAADAAGAETQRLVIATRTMPREAWVKTRVFSWLTSLLHFNKLLQIPFVVMHETCGVSYRSIIEAFAEPGADRPIMRELIEFFTAQARSIQQGGPDYHHSREWLDIWWPHDEYQFIELCARGRLDNFYAEAGELLGNLAVRSGAGGDLGFIDDAVRLNRAALKLPMATAEAPIELGSNVSEVYSAALSGDTMPLRAGHCRCRIVRSDPDPASWEEWCRKVVWYGNKRGDYLDPVEPVDEAARP
ncbi:MAG: cobalamin-dependent protein [bacterium]